MRFRFWIVSISPHRASTLNALAKISETKVQVFVQNEFPDYRIEMGCSEPELKNMEVISRIGDIKKSKDVCSPVDIEIFAGPWANSCMHRIFEKRLRFGSNVAVMSESDDWRGIAGMLRLFRGKVRSFLYSDYIKFILANGKTGEDWFKRCGYPYSKIVPFCYTTSEDIDKKKVRKSEGDYEITFIGNLINIKGVDLLLFALQDLRYLKWKLNIVGDGKMRKRLEYVARKVGIEDYVIFHGYRANEDAMEIVSESDLVVLPSKKDGWGAVVNESLHRGVPVICSDNCGAQSLIESDVNGSVFKSGSVDDLKRNIQRYILEEERVPRKSMKIVEHSKCFTGKTVAKYLIGVTKYYLNKNGHMPVCPWKKN